MKYRITFLPGFIVLFVIVVLGLFPLTVTGQDSGIPKLINYQGYLTDKAGKALTGNYQITFQLYDDANAANPSLWKETQDSVTVVSGQFNVLLGCKSELSADDFDGDRYLSIQMAGESEMKPLMQLVSVAYSLQAEEAEHANTAEKANNAGLGTRVKLYEQLTPAWHNEIQEIYTETATTDGFVVAIATFMKNNCDFLLLGWIDAIDYPLGSASVNGVSGEDYAIYSNSFTMPVRAGENWKIQYAAHNSVHNNEAGHIRIYWIPLGQ